MGNGEGVKTGSTTDITVDIETSGVLTVDQLSEAIMKSQQNFGSSNMLIMSHQMAAQMTYLFDHRYGDLPWSRSFRLTKREEKFAGLHYALYKLGVLKKLSTDDHEEIKAYSMKRLKRAKWARYQK